MNVPTTEIIRFAHDVYMCAWIALNKIIYTHTHVNTYMFENIVVAQHSVYAIYKYIYSYI